MIPRKVNGQNILYPNNPHDDISSHDVGGDVITVGEIVGGYDIVGCTVGTILGDTVGGNDDILLVVLLFITTIVKFNNTS